MKKFYCALKILSYGAFFNFINSVRNCGKTTAFKMRALKRFIKRGKKTIWVRRFKKEADATAREFYTEKIKTLLKNENIILTDDNFKWIGRKGYYKRGGKFIAFISVIALSEYSNVRSVDDIAENEIIFDEYTATKTRLNQYHGNEVVDFLDLLTTKKRITKRVKVFFLGNKETALNPYLTYFGLPQTGEYLNGITTYKNGSIAVENINETPETVKNSYSGKFEQALTGTPFYDYLTVGTAKTAVKRIKNAPQNARRVFQIDFVGLCSVYVDSGIFYVKNGGNKFDIIYTDTPKKYARQFVTKSRDRTLFDGFISAYKLGRVFYETASAYELFLPFLQLFNLG